MKDHRAKDEAPIHARELHRNELKTVVGTMFLLIVLIGSLWLSGPSRAEYGDVVINNFSDESGMRPVVFPHWFHRIRFRCKVCHADLGFKFKAGGNDISMLKIIDGEYCGACHNGNIAWSVENCNLCHSGKSGTKTQVHESTLQKLVAPVSK
jgi:c(7)-type cytochrome triheme protein